MNYRDLVKIVAQKNDVTYQQAESLANSLLETIADQIKSGHSVRLKHFATLRPTYVPARDRYIPGSNEVKAFPATITLKIIPSKQLKEKLQLSISSTTEA